LPLSSSFIGSSPDEWISQAEAARLRGVSRQAIADLIAREKVETFKIGGRILVRRKDIEHFRAEKGGRPPRR